MPGLTMNNRWGYALICLLLASIPVICNSQTTEIPDISADRPGVATSPAIVPLKSFQIETGFSYEKIICREYTQETTSFNSVLLRYGMSQSSEIRFQTDYLRVKTDSLSTTGFDPVSIGTKIGISKARGIMPKTSLLFNLLLPYFGERTFRPEEMAPSLYLLMQNEITKKTTICYNIGIEYNGGSSAPAAFAALCLGYSLTEKLSTFVESYNWFCSGSKPETYLDLGCAWIIRKNLQADISGNFNLQDIENYYMINVGIAWRIPQ
jgi:hypothetical protein